MRRGIKPKRGLHVNFREVSVNWPAARLFEKSCSQPRRVNLEPYIIFVIDENLGTTLFPQSVAFVVVLPLAQPVYGHAPRVCRALAGVVVPLVGAAIVLIERKRGGGRMEFKSSSNLLLIAHTNMTQFSAVAPSGCPLTQL